MSACVYVRVYKWLYRVCSHTCTSHFAPSRLSSPLSVDQVGLKTWFIELLFIGSFMNVIQSKQQK